MANPTLKALKDFIQRHGEHTVVITGAGMSTASGLPDYRGPRGAYSLGHRPTQMAEFMGDEDLRRRYWLRNSHGWPFFRTRVPNKAHYLVAELQNKGRLGRVITQNVDRLHQTAGSPEVLELHGNNFAVQCQDKSCEAVESREGFHIRVIAANPRYRDSLQAAELQLLNSRGDSSTDSYRPDGDTDLAEHQDVQFRVPNCHACRVGIVKPTLVFFGGSIPQQVTLDARSWIDKASGLLVLGTTLQTPSAFHLFRRAVSRSIPTFCINQGETRADGQFTYPRADMEIAMALEELL